MEHYLSPVKDHPLKAIESHKEYIQAATRLESRMNDATEYSVGENMYYMALACLLEHCEMTD